MLFQAIDWLAKSKKTIELGSSLKKNGNNAYTKLKQKKPTYNKPSHQYFSKLAFNSKTRIFKSITTNKNNTEMAPT